MKPEQVIAELFALVRLLIERQGGAPADVVARLAALENWRAGVEAVWKER